jgi:Alcohol dehydrogenase GroES-like domain
LRTSPLTTSPGRPFSLTRIGFTLRMRSFPARRALPKARRGARQCVAPSSPWPARRLDVELAPLNKHDLLFMRGFFGGPPTPTVVGNEGFGRVAAVGPGVANVKVGEHVLAPIFGLTWRERLIAPAQGLFPLPDGDRLQFAQLGSNPPTAALILSEYMDLKPGDWVVQNGGNSGVGRSLIAIAKLRGVRTISLVRRHELIDELKAAGADLVAAHLGIGSSRAALAPTGRARPKRGRQPFSLRIVQACTPKVHNALLSVAIRIDQQAAIAASHHADAEAHEADRAIAEIVDFPAALGNAIGAEEHDGDLAIGHVVEPPVERTQAQDEPGLPLLGKLTTDPPPATCDLAIEPDSGGGAKIDSPVQRDYRG